MPSFGEIQSALGFLGGIGRRSRRLSNAKTCESAEEEQEEPRIQKRSAHKRNSGAPVDAYFYHTAGDRVWRVGDVGIMASASIGICESRGCADRSDRILARK